MRAVSKGDAMTASWAVCRLEDWTCRVSENHWSAPQQQGQQVVDGQARTTRVFQHLLAIQPSFWPRVCHVDTSVSRKHRRGDGANVRKHISLVHRASVMHDRLTG